MNDLYREMNIISEIRKGRLHFFSDMRKEGQEKNW